MSKPLTSQPTQVPSQLRSLTINDPRRLNTTALAICSAWKKGILIYNVASFIKPITPSDV